MNDLSDREYEIRKIESDLWAKLFQDSLLYTKEYGVSTIRSLVLLNGGSVIAMLGFVGTFAKAENLEIISVGYVSISLSFYILGLLLAVGTGSMGYLNFQILNKDTPRANHIGDYLRGGERKIWAISRWLRKTSSIAIVFSLGSALSFATGTAFALCVLLRLGE